MNTERLLHLANHLRTSRGLGQFKFDVLFQNQPCGTVGCALGECPFAFPEDWQLHERGSGFTIPCLRPWLGACESAREFFGLDEAEAVHLFYDGCQRPDLYGGELLGPDATAENVASNIEAFILHVSA